MSHPIMSANWHYAPGAKRTEVDDDPITHGTCVASKIAGARFGVAKDTHIEILKATLNVADLTWAFLKARDDIRWRNREKKSVILFTGGALEPFYPGQDLQQPWTRLKQLMQDLIDADVVIVVSSGNQAQRNPRVDLIPAVWATRDYPLVVVGSVDNDGKSAWFSQGPNQVTAYAPGNTVQCALDTEYRSQFRYGTSYSAAMVSAPKDSKLVKAILSIGVGSWSGSLFPWARQETFQGWKGQDSVECSGLHSNHSKLAKSS